MDDGTALTIAVGGVLYYGDLRQWRDFTSALVAGRIGAYKKSPAYRNQSLSDFIGMLRRLWNPEKKGPRPEPEAFGLVPLRPDGVAQADLIDALIGMRTNVA
jgi:hypothetical protein